MLLKKFCKLNINRELIILNQIRWRPEIGDPTVMGWITVAAYFTTALSILFLSNKNKISSERVFWNFLLIFLFILGINKQLDLQSLLTDIGRIIAKDQGWYEFRRKFQYYFVIGLFFSALTVSIVVFKKILNYNPRLSIPAVGFSLLLGFIVIRAVSFHHVDMLLKFRIGGIKLNWLFELSGLGIIFTSVVYELIYFKK